MYEPLSLEDERSERAYIEPWEQFDLQDIGNLGGCCRECRSPLHLCVCTDYPEELPRD